MNKGVIIWIAVVMLLSGITVWLAVASYEFSKQRRLIKMEIRRALDYNEQRHWKRELKALYLSLIPGISLEKAKQIVRKRRK